MDKKYVRVLHDTWTNSTRLSGGMVMEVDEETAERWEEAGIVEFTTERVYKAQQDLAREERQAVRDRNLTPEQRQEREREEQAARELEEREAKAEEKKPEARMISREQAPK
jgi:hypothetical protein